MKRQANFAADFMAKLALSGSVDVWLEESPPGLDGILSNDVALIFS